MFGFGTGKRANPNVYAAPPSVKNQQKKKQLEPLRTPSFCDGTSYMDSFEPAIDGPPSPERIRAYTEQMKRSSIFGNNSSRTMLSSGPSSFRSRDVSAESLTISRESSGRSSARSMTSSRLDRPESVQIFGRSIFPRRSKRTQSNKDGLRTGKGDMSEGTIRNDAGSQSSSRRGTMTFSTSSSFTQESRTRQMISSPFNFQHVAHTGQNQLPNLKEASGTGLASEFSAIRNSQMPTNDLNCIHAQDLHFNNFSSEDLGLTTEAQNTLPPMSSHLGSKSVLKNSFNAHRSVTHTKSHDNFRTSPTGPPRSPLSPTYPIELPVRTSSRTSSSPVDAFDPLATSSIERPVTRGGFRRLAPFKLSIPTLSTPPEISGDDYFSSTGIPHAVTIPNDEAWPLTGFSSASFGELADVQEEDENPRRKSRYSGSSGELRTSHSVPALRFLSFNQNEVTKAPLSMGFMLSDDSWDNAIDYAYEHEAEADCDYQWDQGSADDDTETVAQQPSPPLEKPILDLHLDDSRQSTYNGRFRPSLLVPTSLDLPELSPGSMISPSTIASDPRTPSNFLRPQHVRSQSHTSSFRESNCFNRSPSLLIPCDFQLQMDHDSIYEQYHQDASVPIFPQDHYVLPIDEGASSTFSYRSSGFSRGSARSSSSTRISGSQARGSQDSTILISRTASLNAAHRTTGSASSLPDLVPSASSSKKETNLSQMIATTLKFDDDDGDINEGILHQTSDLHLDHGRGAVVEPYSDLPVSSIPAHGRQSSAPVLSHSVREFKGRARSSSNVPKASKKQRGSYMLFPQV
ncbi:hypothetical protein BJ878DRAFT_497296 [Calycina marina]|uniref:CRIB domain-containing protein n=1 Tax=Calycina marina TaxID=1763456 RepID=A0A9P7Z6X4_9HELO|nr:hypothetical protein BJ878DRAFT_497296 [Calycina marina]